MPQKNGFFAEDDSSTGLTSGIYWQTAGDLMGGGGVLVSHCREDAPGHTSRLVDRLRAQFKDRGVLFDFLEGRTGADLSGAVQGVVASCDAVLAVIGSSWLACVSGRRIRPSDAIPDTFCLEIAAALSRNVPVIPVLVQGAAMPRPETLPEGIRDLSRRQAFELRDRNWDRDVGELTAVLNQILTEKGGQAATVGMRGRRNFLAIAGALFAISVAAYWARSSSGRGAKAGPPIIEPQMTITAPADALVPVSGQKLLSSSQDPPKMIVWDLYTSEGHEIRVKQTSCFTATADGRIALGYFNGIRIWNPNTGQIEQTIRLNELSSNLTDQGMSKLTLLSDARLLSITGVGPAIWDVTAGRGENLYRAVGQAELAVLLADGRFAFSRTDGIVVWNPKTHQLEGKAKVRNVKSLAALPDGGIAFSTINTGMNLWDPQTGKTTLLGRGANTYDAHVAVLSNKWLVALSGEAFETWNLSTLEPGKSSEHRFEFTFADPVPLPHSRLAIGLRDGPIGIWNANTGRLESILRGHTKNTKRLVALPNNRLASAAIDDTIRIWNLDAEHSTAQRGTKSK